MLVETLMTRYLRWQNRNYLTFNEIAPREMPFSPIALENMLKLSRLGVHIAPPVPGYYAEHDSLEAMERFWIGKWYDLLGIDHDLYRRWEGDGTLQR